MDKIEGAVLELYRLAQSETPDTKRLAYVCADALEAIAVLLYEGTLVNNKQGRQIRHLIEISPE